MCKLGVRICGSVLKAFVSHEIIFSAHYKTFLYFRLVTSGYLRENAADYEGFIDGGRTVEQFCQSEIEPMFKDCDHLAIIALTKAIGIH